MSQTVGKSSPMTTTFFLTSLVRVFRPILTVHTDSVDGTGVELALWDLSGQQEYPQLRKPSYDQTDVILICYRADSPYESARQSVKAWAEESTDLCPDAPVVLVGIIDPHDDYQIYAIQTHHDIFKAAKETGCMVVNQVLYNLERGKSINDVFEAVGI